MVSGTAAGAPMSHGSGTTNVFTVEVAQAQDSATAQADWTQAQTAVEQKLPSGVSVSLDTQNVTGLGDRAATATGSTSVDGQSLGFSGIYLLKGATFLAFQDVQLGNAAPTASAVQTEAATALARTAVSRARGVAARDGTGRRGPR